MTDQTDQTPTDQNADAPAAPAPDAVQADAVAPVRPEGVPDELWDEKTGFKFDDALKSINAYNDLVKSAPAKVEDIDVSLPKDLDPDNPDTVWEINKEDPVFKSVAETLVANKVPQGAISEIVKAYAQSQIASFKEAQELLKAEQGKLGDKHQERFASARDFVAGVVGKEKADRFASTWVTAEQVQVIEALMKHAAGPQGTSSPEPVVKDQPTKLNTPEGFKAAADKMFPPENDPFKRR